MNKPIEVKTRKNNSVYDIVAYMQKFPAGTVFSENMIMLHTFGYDRRTSNRSNKKYADMLRRGVSNGFFIRSEMIHPNDGARIGYILNNKEFGNL